MATLAAIVERLKGEVTETVSEDLIRQLCRELGYGYRERDLGPVVTTYLFLQQILHGNVPIGELRRLSGVDFTDAGYCQARARLPLALLERLQQAVTATLRANAEDDAEGRWHGHRVYHLDGSSFSMSDTPELQQEFGQPSGQADGCGFPMAHLLVLFHAHSGYLLKTLARPLHTHDLSQVAALHPELKEGDILVGDRAFASYAHLALCQQRQLHGVFRAHQKQIVSFRPGRRRAQPGERGQPSSRWLRRLGKHDQLVEYFKPKRRPTWLTPEAYAQLPDSLVVREIRYPVRQRGYRTRVVTLVTTLLDPELYPAEALAELYGQRWQVETNLRHLKQTLKMDILRCQTVAGVRKELTLFVLVYNLVRRVMREAARRQGVEPERISFVDAWRWLRHARPEEELPALVVNPDRPGRVQPRVRKRRPKEFPVMKRPRAELRKALFGKRPAA